jgi:hypothetical protein
LYTVQLAFLFLHFFKKSSPSEASTASSGKLFIIYA